MFPYYFIRFSGPVLFILVGLKILSGYSLEGKVSGFSWLSPLHQYQALDIALLFVFVFHALYGLRLFLIDLGMMRKENVLFWVSTSVSVGLLIFSYLYFF
jgi:succinate dehydrogenase/fumarate reductase cytochrome b subunit